MEAFDQLLTCCVCLDRYKNPKLLPCQHSYCMEPCMEGLVDYVKRQVKCPECRAEHRIPYNGIQGFPTNYTLTKFLELHAEITGIVCLTYLLMFHSSHFSFLVFWSLLATKLRKYYVIFVYILQGKMGKTGKNGKEIMQLMWPKLKILYILSWL